MQASIIDIHSSLIEGNPVTVKLGSRQEANTLRIALWRRHREFQAVGISDEDVTMQWNPKGSFVVYRLTKRQPKTFELVSGHEDIATENANIQADLDSDQSQQRAGSDSLSEKFPATIDQQDAAVQMRGEYISQSCGPSIVWENGDRQN